MVHSQDANPKGKGSYLRGKMLWYYAARHWLIQSFGLGGAPMCVRSAVVLGCFLVAASVLHVGLSAAWPWAAKPLRTGYVSGDIVYRIDATATGTHKADGFRVACYDAFVLVYVDKAKQPTWTGNYVLAIPWHRVESLTLRPGD